MTDAALSVAWIERNTSPSRVHESKMVVGSVTLEGRKEARLSGPPQCRTRASRAFIRSRSAGTFPSQVRLARANPTPSANIKRFGRRNSELQRRHFASAELRGCTAGLRNSHSTILPRTPNRRLDCSVTTPPFYGVVFVPPGIV